MGKKGRFESSDFREGGHRQGGVGAGQAQGRRGGEETEGPRLAAPGGQRIGRSFSSPKRYLTPFLL